MSLRIDTTSWIPGALVIGNTGLGVLGSAIPSTGDSGPGYAYNDLTLPADADKEICGRITAWPTNGTLDAEEDTSFEYVGTADTFEYQLYVDGVAVGSPTTVTLSFGGVTHTSTASIVAGAATISASSERVGTHASSGAIVAQSASVSATSAKYALHTSTGALVASAAVISSTASRYVTHDSSGALVASSAIVAASSIRVDAPVTHTSSGALVAQHASISSAASRSVYHTSTGNLVASGAAISASAMRDIPPFTSEELAFLVAYLQENMMIPTAEQVAAAVVLALQATAIPVNVTQFNGNATTGTGKPGDPVTAV